MEDEPPHGEPGEPAATPRAPGPQVLDDDRAFPVRFLLSAPACGAIIGKAGSVVSEFEAQSGARIQLSKPREVFPGTQERILLLTGSINAILTALHLLLTRAASGDPPPGAEPDAPPPPPPAVVTVRLLLPNTVVGAVLGKGGSTIAAFCEDSGANVRVSSKDACPPGVTDRTVSVTGSMEQALRAVALIVSKATDEPGYPQALSRPYDYAPATQQQPQPAQQGGQAGGGRGGVGGSGGGSGSGGAARGGGGGGGAPGAPPAPTVTVVVGVPDEHVGALIGRAGATVAELQSVAGVSIRVSGRDDLVANTNHRKISITGSPDAVQVAQYLVQQKVAQSVEMLERRRGGGDGGRA